MRRPFLMSAPIMSCRVIQRYAMLGPLALLVAFSCFFSFGDP